MPCLRQQPLLCFIQSSQKSNDSPVVSVSDAQILGKSGLLCQSFPILRHLAQEVTYTWLMKEDDQSQSAMSKDELSLRITSPEEKPTPSQTP